MSRDNPGTCLYRRYRRSLLEPGRQETLDVAATARALQSRCDRAILDDDQRRHRLDLEMLQQVRPLLLGDTHELERPVIPPPLKNLREEALNTPTMP